MELQAQREGAEALPANEKWQGPPTKLVVERHSRLRRLILGTARARRGEKRPANKKLFRLREIERIIKHRHGQFIPDTDDADFYFLVAARSINAMCQGAGMEETFRGWLRRYAPWSLPRAGEVIRPVLYEIENWKYDMDADKAADILSLTEIERTELKIRTIGIKGKTKAQRKKEADARKRINDRQRQKAKRKASGAKPRSESIAQTKPWIAAGYNNRRTWERHKKPVPIVANSSRVDIPLVKGLSDETATVVSRYVPKMPDMSPTARRGLPSFQSLNGTRNTDVTAGSAFVARNLRASGMAT